MPSSTMLILEGGGMRGAFTAGVLAALMDAGLDDLDVMSLSSGTLCGAFYHSGQRAVLPDIFPTIGRIRQGLFGLRSWLSGKGLFNLDYLVEQAGLRERFDANSFFAKPSDFWIGATRVDDAKLLFWNKSCIKDEADLFLRMQASASLPILAPAVNVDGRTFVDGGVIHSIPLTAAFEQGVFRVLIVHTQPMDYRRPRQFLPLVARLALRNRPAILGAIDRRHLRYNRTLLEIAEAESEGRALMISPTQSLVDRYGKDLRNLEAFYEQGYQQTGEQMALIRAFLQEDPHGQA